MAADDADGMTSYLLEVPTDDWEHWKDSIPRSIPLYQRIRILLQVDATLDGEADVASLKLLHMKVDRIHERARTAQNALSNDDPHKARAELESIEDLAKELQP